PCVAGRLLQPVGNGGRREMAALPPCVGEQNSAYGPRRTFYYATRPTDDSPAHDADGGTCTLRTEEASALLSLDGRACAQRGNAQARPAGPKAAFPAASPSSL